MDASSINTPYNQLPKQRDARFINPPNLLKQKVGSGGLSKDILQKAQKLLEENNIDFPPIGDNYLERLRIGIENAQTPPKNIEPEQLLAGMIYPSMQLKANGGMFHYELVSKISERIVLFLEVVDEADDDVIEIVQAYYTTIRAIFFGKMTGDGGARGTELSKALEDACQRYFEKQKK